jgi:hypothetical protein
MPEERKTFSVENKINPLTNQPFGSKYGGNFTIRRPSLMDKSMIATRVAAAINIFGFVDVSQIPLKVLEQIQTTRTVRQLADEKDIPAWFDLSKLFDEHDEAALEAVSEEVDGFIKSFHAGGNNNQGGTGS